MTSQTLAKLLAAALALSPIAAFAQPSGADASNAAASTAPAAPAAPAPAPAPAGAPLKVALVITPDLQNTVWSKESALMRPFYAQGEENNLGHAVTAALEAMTKTMGLDAQVIASTDEASKMGGAAYILVPTLQRYEQHNEGLTTFAPFTETLALQWKVTDAKGNNVLLDTVLATSTGHLGNNFIANSRAKKIEADLLDQATSKSIALLKPVLVSQ